MGKALFLTSGLLLLQAYNKRECDSDKQLNNFKETELNNLREAIAEKLVDGPDHLTTAVVNSWLPGDEKEQHEVLTEDEIISYVLDNSDEDEAEERTTSSTVSTNMHTVNNDTAVNALATQLLGLTKMVFLYLTPLC
ncbi:hypothetical protein QE152_g19053 [Popillia japonica]|uniref:Uncharacterized protein n=1 Tax=Popillia japonica TaxID=7064 RepID=A0AAW1L3S0_POPJA